MLLLCSCVSYAFAAVVGWSPLSYKTPPSLLKPPPLKLSPLNSTKEFFSKKKISVLPVTSTLIEKLSIVTLNYDFFSLIAILNSNFNGNSMLMVTLEKVVLNY